MTTVESPRVSRLLLPAKTWPAPDRGLLLATGVAALVMVEAASRYSFPFFFIGGMAGLVVGFTWLFRLVPTLVHRRLRLGRREWFGWLIVPVLLAGAWLTVLTPVPFELRLAASRGAMDEAAQA